MERAHRRARDFRQPVATRSRSHPVSTDQVSRPQTCRAPRSTLARPGSRRTDDRRAGRGPGGRALAVTVVLVAAQGLVFGIAVRRGVARTPYAWVFRTAVRPGWAPARPRGRRTTSLRPGGGSRFRAARPGRLPHRRRPRRRRRDRVRPRRRVPQRRLRPLSGLRGVPAPRRAASDCTHASTTANAPQPSGPAGQRKEDT